MSVDTKFWQRSGLYTTCYRLSERRSAIKKLVLPVVIIAAGIGIIALIGVTRPQPQADETALAAVEQIDVTVKPAKRQTVTLSASGQGTVFPKRQIELVAQVSGSVVWVAAGIDDGAFFRSGTPLVRIDKRDYQAALSSTEARVAAARRALAEEQGRARQAKREWRDLGNKTANELFLRTPQLAEAQSELDAAEADLRLARVNLERTSLVGPFDGRVSKLHVDLGQYVAAGTPVATIYDTSAAEVRIPLTDKQLAILQLPLGRATEAGPAVEISARVAGQTRIWSGFITRTDASVDTMSRMYYAIAEIKNPFGTDTDATEVPLMPGLFVTAEIAGKELDDVLVLPRQALVRRSFVYVLDKDNRVRSEGVEVLKKSESTVWLRSRVEEGTMIVLDKHALLSTGIEVDPVTAAETDSSGTALTGDNP